jgi:hypothetical protein
MMNRFSAGATDAQSGTGSNIPITNNRTDSESCRKLALIVRILRHVQQRLERLCRYITRPPIAIIRQLLDSRDRTVSQYRFRGGSTRVVPETGEVKE